MSALSIEKARNGHLQQSPWSSRGASSIQILQLLGSSALCFVGGAAWGRQRSPPSSMASRLQGWEAWGPEFKSWLSWCMKPFNEAIFLWNSHYLPTVMCLEWKPVWTSCRSYLWQTPMSSGKRWRKATLEKQEERPYVDLWWIWLRTCKCVLQKLNLFFIIKKVNYIIFVSLIQRKKNC